MSSSVSLLSSIIFFLTFFIIKSKETDESFSLQRYLPLGADDQLLNTDKRFQQIMQGGSPSDVGWQQPPKLKSEKIDIKAEISKLNSTYVYQSSWPEAKVNLGQVTAVSFDRDGNVVIFHRVDRIWEQNTFDNANNFRQRSKGPIQGSTVLAFEREHGHLVYEWGKNIFYMPHGLTVDHENNVWVTDVALHQVLKFGPRGSNDKALMTLGTAFTPGAGEKKFCKPTSVAVLENGDFFVADGYCNARINKYSKNGEKILSWGQNSFAGVSYEVAPKNFFAIPHALTLVPEQKLICAADRENGRVQCFYWTNATFHSQYHSQIIGDRLFSMDYTPAQGGQLVIVNGPTAEFGSRSDHYNEVRGYVLQMSSKKVLSKFGPNDMPFDNPHDVAVTKDANEIYVAELNPKRIHKFLHKSVAKPVAISAAKGSVGPAYVLARNAKINGSMAAMSKNSPPQDSSLLSADAAAAANVNADADTDAATLASDGSTADPKHKRPGGTAILVASLMLLFAVSTFLLALIMARRRKRENGKVSGSFGSSFNFSLGFATAQGCMPFGVKSRRHAWDFPANKSEGFNLGGLLADRSKRSGFEKLDQNASDEENETAVMNAPFA